ncbi:MAG TPA: hypothetical protein VL092_10350 [Chitinophagaceae bacterium]|nr:hypothetical protein [Chitinophagaceae bacterium]
MTRLFLALRYLLLCSTAAALSYACTPKKVSSSQSDARLYPDDSEINMKTTEKKMKRMPFDTSAVPVVPRRKN